MNNKIINILIIFFIIAIIYYLYDIFFNIYEPMECQDKTTDYLKQDLNKFETKLDNNSESINKLFQDIELMRETIDKNKSNIEDNQKSIVEFGTSFAENTSKDIPEVDLDNVDLDNIDQDL